jgi:hypothetical protein
LTRPAAGVTIGHEEGNALGAKWPARSLIVAASGVAGVAHVLAAEAHTRHPVAAMFFVVLAIAQVVWAAVVASDPRRDVLWAGASGNTLVVGIWLISRTLGFGFVPGLEGREPVGRLDLVATIAEVVVVAGALFLLEPDVGRRVRFESRELATAAMALGVVVLALPPVMGTPVGAHEHLGHDLALHETTHGHGTGPHLHAASHAAHDPAAHSAHAAHAATHGDHAGAQHAAAHHHATTETAPPLPGARGILATVQYGPFTLTAAKADSGKSASPVLSNIIRTKLQPPCTNCYLTAMEPDLVYADGSSANFDTGVMLHHGVLGDSSQPDLTCGRNSTIGWLGRRFFASGNERTKGVLPAPFGYRIGGSDWWTGIFEIMNFNSSPQTVWFKFTVHYLQASDESVKPVVPVWLDKNNCGNSEYSIPAGRSTTTWDWTSSITGRVVFVGGHVHNWGQKISLSNATTGERTCKSVAGYGTKPAYQGNIESMTSCVWDRVGTVRAGETLEIAATYESPEARNDVMGIMLAYVYETSDLSGGTRAPESVTNPRDGGSSSHPSHNH